MAKNLPPIFKVSNNSLTSHNQKYTYTAKEEVRKEEYALQDKSIDEKIKAIFNTKGYAFNIPVQITFAGKTIDTYLAMYNGNELITLDNEIIPISTITDLTIKKPSI